MQLSTLENNSPDYSLKLCSVNIYNFSEAFTFPQSENQRLWIIISGNGAYYNTRDEQTRKYKKLSFISKECSAEWIFTPANSQTSVFCAEYKLYASSPLADDNAGRGYQRDYRIFSHEFEWDAKQATDYLPDAATYLQAMLDVSATEQTKAMILSRRIEYIVTTAIEYERINNDMVFGKVSAVAFEYFEPMCLPELALDIGNIKIQSAKPHEAPDTFMTFFASHKFVELPRQPDNYVYELHNDPVKNEYCKFTVKSSDLFKIWFFREHKTDDCSLTDILKTGYISFSVRSNEACKLQISLYSIPSYISVRYYFEIKQADEWTEFKIPLLTNQKSANKSPYVLQALKYIQDNFREKITVDEIAKHILINPTYLSGLFHREVGQPITSYINFCRINLAKQLLFETDETITAIAAQTGFYDSSHFLKAFKKAVGITPKEYRRTEKKKK